MRSTNPVVIIGASHGGVNCAFALRREGWEGEIILIDADPNLPYHRPPLSKEFLVSDGNLEKHFLKSSESYTNENISLVLGKKVVSIEREKGLVKLEDNSEILYSHLVIATGARALMPGIQGIGDTQNLFVLRNAEDAIQIRAGLDGSKQKVLIIGGGFIGLEIAASIRKLGAEVCVLEREERILSRVTSEQMSEFFTSLHEDNGVRIYNRKNVESIEFDGSRNQVKCSDQSQFEADVIVVGVGVHVNLELAREAGLEINNGIVVDSHTRTNDPNIYAIGDCTFHHNPHYDRHVRLESVQNAVDQGKIAAAGICGREADYNSIPWFWSDQYEVKLQMVGLAEGHTEVLKRSEEDENKFSLWYFREDELLAVDAVNNPKAYVLGTKFIKEGQKVNKTVLADSSQPLKPLNLILEKAD